MYYFVFTDITGCSEYAVACYNSGKYTEAILWCDHALDRATAGHPIVFRAKSCKGKALAQMYLHNQLQRLQRSDQWTMMGYDQNIKKAALSTKDISSLQIDNELIQLCFADLQNWKSLCSQGEQAIKLLGEVLDSSELDEQGSELLDWVMMDYYRESGAANKCRRCLLCRKIGELVLLVPKFVALEAECLASKSILSLHSFIHFERLQNVFMFCKECELVLSIYGSELILSRLSNEQVLSLLNATDCIHGKPVTYGTVFYLHLMAKFARKLPLVYDGYCSNWEDIYNTFVACRQMFLSHDIHSGIIYFPKVYLFNNPNTWYRYVSTDQSTELYRFSSLRHVTAMIPSKQSFGKGEHVNQFDFFMMHTEGCTIVVELCSETKKHTQLSSQYLISPSQDGGSYLLPHLSEQWEAFPQEVIQAFHTVMLADERRNVGQHILRSEGKDTAHLSVSRSSRFWLPKRRFLSFLPEGFSLEVDSDTIRSISLPAGHKILCHSHDGDKSLTTFLAYATNSTSKKKQYYFIFTCKLHNYFIAAGLYMKGETIEQVPFSNPFLFPMCQFSLPVSEVSMIYELLFQKFPTTLLLKSLSLMLVDYANLGFEAMSIYEDITR